MRYTLRLLTLDQLGRGAALICAMELERRNDVDKLGKWPFEIGLWVGQAATPNRMGKSGERDENTARARTRKFKQDQKTSVFGRSCRDGVRGIRETSPRRAHRDLPCAVWKASVGGARMQTAVAGERRPGRRLRYAGSHQVGSAVDP
jgi:hypothetical protein